MKDNKKKDLDKNLDKFLGQEEFECTGDECKLKSKDGLVEIVNKKYVVEDGRELLT